ncbi:MAG: putative bifunctional diguanylate cyclase/phosphodiesterase [Ilumatobacteraceae bacterium]
MSDHAGRSTSRLFVIYAAISLVPLVLLGAALATTYQTDARGRGRAEGASQAELIADNIVEPLLAGQPLDDGLTSAERSSLENLVARVTADHSVLRLRLRGLNGIVVFSGDGSGMTGVADNEAIDAGAGEDITVLTEFNADRNDTGPTGEPVVEAYRQLSAGTPPNPVGVLELYLPYGPISQDVSAALHHLYRDLVLGLALLWLLLLGICISVTRGLRKEVALSTFLAEHDPLTELPNRLVFHRRAKVALAEAAREHAPLAIAIIDLDRFKEINDTLGHQNGDVVLIELANRLRGSISDRDTVARLGGDEYGLILHGVDDAASLASRITGVLDHDVEVGGLHLTIEASIGFVVAPEDGTEVDELLQRADVAMYVAKTKQVAAVRYDVRDDHYSAGNFGLIGELREGIDNGELVLHYQPKVLAINGRLEAVEALARWQHPVHGILNPDKFIPLAEHTDLIDNLTMWALTTALTEIRRLGPMASDVAVSVNVSARNLARADFAERVVGILKRLGVPAHRLVVEITETALLTDPLRAASVLDELASAGVNISLDDFGCGQTLLGYLSTLPLHELKIDKSFVTDMMTDAAHDAIVRSIIDLGHNLGLRVVGEGVETTAVLLRLRASGCDVVQGFLLGRPMTFDQLARWMTTLLPQGVVPAWNEATSMLPARSGPGNGHGATKFFTGVEAGRAPDRGTEVEGIR